MAEFKLSASLPGHDDDVRSLVYPSPDLVLSSSWDATVRQWKLIGNNPPSFDCTLNSTGTGAILAVAFVPPSTQYPDGLIVSGGRDPVIEVRQPGDTVQDNALALLPGHTSTVCCLDVSESGKHIASGGWDRQAIIWHVGDWENTTVLGDHGGNVLDVLFYDKDTVITACADEAIRIFKTSGAGVGKVSGQTLGIVRALCRIPKGFSIQADFASAGNDGYIRLFTLNCQQIRSFQAHDNLIYCLSALPTGEIISASEDRTAKVWQGDRCVQAITHPAGAVWSVAACAKSGDIVTGGGDRIIRVFTRSVDRQADEAAIQAFEESIKASSIPKEHLEDLDTTSLPGPEFLPRHSGQKEGHVQMIKEHDGSITAHQWSETDRQWVKVGTVVDSAGSSGRKKEFNGLDYDYVFSVDVKEGAAPMALPYNLSENPYEAASKFLADHDLPAGYLNQVAEFIIRNSQGARVGQPAGPQTQTPGSDPWGSGSRYRPGDADASAIIQSRPKVLPQTQYLPIISANLRVMQKKIQDFNQEFLDTGDKSYALNPTDLNVLSATIGQLEQDQTSDLEEGSELAIRLVSTWPMEKQLPVTDLLAILAASSPTVVEYTSSGSETIVDLLSRAFQNTGNPNHATLATRGLANLFSTEQGRLVMDGEFEKVQQLLQPYVDEPEKWKKSFIVAIATVFINYTVMLSASSSASASDPPSGPNADRALALLADTTALIKSTKDSEVMYRSLVAAGTLLTLGADFRMAAREVFDLERCLIRASTEVPEPRIMGVVVEMKDELNG
ncbi:MAG: hypothetical protein M1821_003006 [Bathelium mastoideum]|nr:MAG: hypothetical protein M1821_003006 [Bathelium mastoideum]KAI9681898.1 MAG: hypothetical protein M1822_006975 [Bathelium mastoideum]